MDYEELDHTTRGFMLREFEAEERTGSPYRSPRLSQAGRSVWPELMAAAIDHGDDETLRAALSDPRYFVPTEMARRRGGAMFPRRVNPFHAAETLALTEFNTWYVRGLASRLLAEGVEWCQAYRAGVPKYTTGRCSVHEERLFLVQEIYDGHRAAYWPEPGRPAVLSIPCHPNCHHSIRRAREVEAIAVARRERAAHTG